MNETNNMAFPRVLILINGKINFSDNSNNGLLLRNLFEKWPRHNLAQIFTSGDNGDKGYFDYYYQILASDRIFGSLFYKLKKLKLSSFDNDIDLSPTTNFCEIRNKSTKNFFLDLGQKFLFKSGFYELIFRPRLSKEMLAWIVSFRPDFIFAQGYSLAFTWLPMLISNHFNLPIVYFPTDDWPTNLYTDGSLLSRISQRVVTNASRKLVESSMIRIAFNSFMEEQYFLRYNKKFFTLMHGDDFRRFERVEPKRLADGNETWIIATGVFDENRIPLLKDLNRACEILVSNDINVRATIFIVNSNLLQSFKRSEVKNLEFLPCPSHSALVAVMKGADILFLPERFNSSSNEIQLSISSKAHLFMYSGTPIVVYSDPIAGVARYAKQEKWAELVDRRDPNLLAGVFEKLINNLEERERLIKQAKLVALKNHDLTEIQAAFINLLNFNVD